MSARELGMRRTTLRYHAAKIADLPRATSGGQRRLAVTTEQMRAALIKNGGNMMQSARELGIHRMSLIHHAEMFTDITKLRRGASLSKSIKKTIDKKEPFFIAPLSVTSQKLVITAAQNATPVHSYFFKALQLYCRENNAQLIVIPYRYKNPTSIFSDAAQEDDFWAPETVPYLLNQRLRLNDSLVVMGDIKTQPTAVTPLSGLETLSGSSSAIIGHPKLELATIATPQKKLPKILTTTGACTMSNYSDSKAGKKGEHHHTYGACVVEIDGDVFHMRQINAVNDGSFIELQHHYSASGKTLAPAPAALILGDLHAEVRDHDVMQVTFGPGGIVDTLKPAHIVYHDLIDFTSRNHHNVKDPFFRYARHHSADRRHDSVEAELREAFAFIDSVTPSFAKNIIVASNHIDALGKWVREFDPRQGDPENALFWTRTYTAMLESSGMKNGGVSTVEPLTHWARQWMATASQTVFLGRGESFALHGIELAMHGDKGPNGARGSRQAFTKIGVKSVIGHSHSPGISAGVYQVGTNSRLDLDYAAGSPSSWLHTDCLVYANGKRTLLNIIGGAWRGKKIIKTPQKAFIGKMEPANGMWFAGAAA